jgi:PKD repeat protein
VTFDASQTVPQALGHIDAYEWDLDGNGSFETSTGTTPTVSRRFDAPGPAQVSVRASGSIAGVKGTATTAVDVQPAPAALTATPAVALTGETVSLDASGSAIPLSDITRFEWDRDGDGSFETDTGTTPLTTTTFAARGVYDLKVRVTRSGGRTDVTTATVDVRLAPPAGELGISINGGDFATNDAKVTVDVVWPARAQSLLISNDGGFGTAGSTATLDVAASVSWQLQPAKDEKLPRTVYVRFRGGDAGRETYTDDIILDETPPTLSAATAEPTDADAAQAAAKRVYKIMLRGKDNAAGITRAQFARSKSGSKVNVKLGRATKVSKRIGARSATMPKWTRIQDAAGNFSKWRRIVVRDR